MVMKRKLISMTIAFLVSACSFTNIEAKQLNPEKFTDLIEKN